MAGHSIAQRPIHLGLGATANAEPEFTGEMAWYEGYVARHADDGFEGRLVAMHSFTGSWDSWEVHPNGAEVVLCLSGSMTLHQEAPDGTLSQVTIGAGEYAINPPGTWHTADIEGEASALFITAGAGTEHRPR
ncbi:MAG: cupin domain-containing protein [Sphingomonadales bacterium]|nr:cupin domain-containing protein [Sphingomonadales bacterium]MDE2567757.1 cupin domain-containing protein [Sphingomonadales bacterium]